MWTRENSLPARIENELEQAKQKVQREHPYQALVVKPRGRTTMSRTQSSLNNKIDGWSQSSNETPFGAKQTDQISHQEVIITKTEGRKATSPNLFG